MDGSIKSNLIKVLKKYIIGIREKKFKNLKSRGDFDIQAYSYYLFLTPLYDILDKIRLIFKRKIFHLKLRFKNPRKRK
ncbi:hypothetical protein HCR_17290 [Hydrogenimonas cancrithermarum]|uniref:Uncharacterized protein n=1 Tax=Hydrogenimonas cancrithermarum TaxID=2993563 RepID=A0ABN6WYZ4_9BACT|nr:hypothetical protein HCR_17290 [Hydrogenimonas cancrithermarum]